MPYPSRKDMDTVGGLDILGCGSTICISNDLCPQQRNYPELFCPCFYWWNVWIPEGGKKSCPKGNFGGIFADFSTICLDFEKNP